MFRPAASEHGALVVGPFLRLVQRRSTGSTVPRRVVEGVIHLDATTSTAACAGQQDWSAASGRAVFQRQKTTSSFRHSGQGIRQGMDELPRCCFNPHPAPTTSSLVSSILKHARVFVHPYRSGTCQQKKGVKRGRERGESRCHSTMGEQKGTAPTVGLDARA